MKCQCDDCTQCPYEYCVDETKDNSDSEMIKLREYNNHYYHTHADIICSREKARYYYKKEHGICVKCSQKAVYGLFCKKHRRLKNETC